MPRARTEERIARDKLIINLFLNGQSYRTIARDPRVRLSYKAVGNVVNQYFEGATPRHRILSEQGTAIYVERLEMVLRMAWPQAVSGDLRAIQAVLSVLRAESKFYGLDDQAYGHCDELGLDGDGLNALDRFRQRYRSQPT